MFGNPLSQGGRYSAANCGHHMHGNMKSGIPCKRDLNCPFHGNNSRGIPPGILDIPGHHGPHAPTLAALGHDHMSAVMSRERRERDKELVSRLHSVETVLGDKQAPPNTQSSQTYCACTWKANSTDAITSSANSENNLPSLRELEALHEEKSQRYGARSLAYHPIKLQKVSG